MTAARDPHCTTPQHDSLWSQVAGWSWGEGLLAFRKLLLKGGCSASVWGYLWGALASWLEGSRVNSEKGGLRQVHAVSAAIEESWSEESNEKAAFLVRSSLSLIC